MKPTKEFYLQLGEMILRRIAFNSFKSLKKKKKEEEINTLRFKSTL